MTKMIPPRVRKDTPYSEKAIFERIRIAPDTQGWTALHSLELKRRWGKNVYGEIDFVVLIPSYGIICLEVKGGNQDDYYNRFRERTPIEQVGRTLRPLRQKITDEFGHDSSHSQCAIGYAVVFTDRECPDSIEESERWRVIGESDVDNIRNRIIEIMEEDRKSSRNARVEEIKSRSFELTANQAKEIVQFLRPDFEQVLGFDLGSVEQNLLRLTEEQYDRLDELEENPRCLFLGAAGTGKTILAAEYARRMASDSKKTLFVCFNLLLGDRLQSMTHGSNEIAAGAFYEILEPNILNSSFANEYTEEKRALLDSDKAVEFYDHVYPRYLEKALGEYEREDLFDVLVIDEFQDFLREGVDIISVLDKALRGGWANGNWAIFGDSNQALYSTPMDPAEVLRGYCGHDSFVKARLSVNCRNTRNIAEATSRVTGFNRLRLRRPVDGPHVVMCPWDTDDSYLNKLTELVKELAVEDGVAVEDIIVLSLRRRENSILSGISRIAGFPIKDISERRRKDLTIDVPSALKFSTVRAFKGLESSVVIIIGMDRLDSKIREQLYVGMSRAKTLLALMVNEDIYLQVQGLIGSQR